MLQQDRFRYPNDGRHQRRNFVGHRTARDSRRGALSHPLNDDTVLEEQEGEVKTRPLPRSFVGDSGIRIAVGTETDVGKKKIEKEREKVSSPTGRSFRQSEALVTKYVHRQRVFKLSKERCNARNTVLHRFPIGYTELRQIESADTCDGRCQRTVRDKVRHAQIGHVAERVPDRTEFPIQYGNHLRVDWMEDDVVNFKISVY